MKLSPEEQAEKALDNFENFPPAEMPAGFEQRLFARMDAEIFNVKVPKWFWIAAAVLLLVNLSVAIKFLDPGNSSVNGNSFAQYYFRGGSDWYNQ